MAKPVSVEELKRGGLVKLKEKDMFSVWVKTSCCNLGSVQLRKLAEITDKYARSFLLFTTRQIPIIPFVNIKDVDEVKKELNEVELQLDRCGPRVRNINVCYEDKICPDAVTNSVSLGEKLDSFFSDPILHKIKIGVSGCGKDCVFCRVLTDIGFIGIESGGGKGYDAYLGGRLGLEPSVGIKMAGLLSEEEAVRFVWNYFDLLRRLGKPGERSADIIKRLGAETVGRELTKDLNREQPYQSIECKSKLNRKETDRLILKLRATCGEVTSKQLVRIAGIAEKYGNGFVHFAVRGSPEIPGIDKSSLESIRSELQGAGLRILDEGIGNMQSCFGNYCTESLVDPQNLLRRIEKRVEELGIDNQNITISAAGCPNSCGIAHLNDIGFHGVLEPDVDIQSCNGCGICVAVCRKKAIEIRNELAVVNKERCVHCGACVSACPSGGMIEKQRGFAVLVGYSGGESPRLGHKIAEFVTEDEALKIAEDYLKILQTRMLPSIEQVQAIRK